MRHVLSPEEIVRYANVYVSRKLHFAQIRRRARTVLSDRRRWFSWWATPADRFAFLIACFTLCLFGATLLLWWATWDLVQDARQSGRAWLGAVDASVTKLEIGEIIETVISFHNVGREPAPSQIFLTHDKFSKSQWEDGSAADVLQKRSAACMEVASATLGPISFPVTASANRIDVRSSPPGMIVDQALVDGEDVYAVSGCLLYRTINVLRHTSFCYFFQGKLVPVQHMGQCTVGHAAD